MTIIITQSSEKHKTAVTLGHHSNTNYTEFGSTGEKKKYIYTHAHAQVMIINYFSIVQGILISTMMCFPLLLPN